MEPLGKASRAPHLCCLHVMCPCASSELSKCDICDLRKPVSKWLQPASRQAKGAAQKCAEIQLGELVERLDIPCSCCEHVVVNACKMCQQAVRNTNGSTGRAGLVASALKRLDKSLLKSGRDPASEASLACFACNHPIVRSKDHETVDAWNKRWESTPKDERPVRPRNKRPLPHFLFRAEEEEFIHHKAATICNSCYRATCRVFLLRSIAVTSALRLLGRTCECSEPGPSWWKLFKDETSFKTVRCTGTSAF